MLLTCIYWLQASKMQRAAQLLGALEGERDRWAQLAEETTRQLDRVLGDSLLAAGLVAYLGCLTASGRGAVSDAKSSRGKYYELAG
jgi:hypothetical protein